MIWRLYLVFVVIVAVLISYSLARAHDHEHPELNGWFKELRSGKGPCCDGSDAMHLRDVDWQTQNKDGSHYRVLLDVSQDVGKVDMQWIDVPDEAVITEPNRDGATLVWPIRGYLGVSIRCFMPGSMT